MEEEEEEEKEEEMKKKKMKTMKTKNNNQRIGFFIIAFDKNSIKWEDRSIAFLYIQRINLPKMQKDHVMERVRRSVAQRIINCCLVKNWDWSRSYGKKRQLIILGRVKPPMTFYFFMIILR